LTAYGGLLPVGTLLEKLGFRQLVEETLKVKRQTRAMPAYQMRKPPSLRKLIPKIESCNTTADPLSRHFAQLICFA
jgi:hypothetical protein